MADYLLFQNGQHKSFSMNSAKRRRMTRQRLLALCSQDFIGTHDETLSVAMRVHNPDRSPFAIQS
jgi:hypothetical protein